MLGSRWLTTSATAALVLGLSACAAIAAEERPSGVVDEIVVTAQKRAETVQTVPMSITALTNQALVRAGVTSFQDYAVHVPNLAFAYVSSLNADGQAIAIRGILGAATTGLYLDDTPLPMSVDPRVLDLDRIEVLKGPQGTLYGARSMGGTVRLITHQPDADGLNGYLHATASDTDHGGANGAVDGAINVPVVPGRVAVRVTGYDDYDSGVFNRTASAAAPVAFPEDKGVDSARHYGGSIAVAVNLLDDKLLITPRVMFAEEAQNGHPYADINPNNFNQPREFDLDEPGGDSWRLYSLTLRYATPVGDITSNTSQFTRRSYDSEDSSEVGQLFFGTPPTPLLYRELGRDQDFSQEVRFASKFRGPFQITTGVFYQNSDDQVIFPTLPLGTFIDNIFSERLDTKVTETAVFGEATYDLTSRLRLIAGARWFDNQVTFNGAQAGIAVTPGVFVGQQRQTGVNPKYGLQYQVSADAMVYATAAKGFRIGGVNSFSDSLCAGDLSALGLTAAQVKTFASDSLWSYEVGAKTSWLDHRLTVDGAVFLIDWANVQQVVSLPQCGFGVSVNSGAARSQGAELDVQFALTHALKLSLGGGYDDAHTTDGGQFHVIAAGTPIQQVPRWTATAALDYSYELGGLPAFAHADYAYVGDSESTINDPVTPRLRPAYTLVNFRLGLDLRQVELALFVDNAFDEHANLSDVPAEAIELPGRPRIATNRPRTVGVDARLKF
jgi:iron complex outermembrane receptor protein